MPDQVLRSRGREWYTGSRGSGARGGKQGAEAWWPVLGGARLAEGGAGEVRLHEADHHAGRAVSRHVTG